MPYNTRASAASRRQRNQITLPNIDVDENVQDSCLCVRRFQDVNQNSTVFPKLTRNHLIIASVLFLILIFLFVIFSDPQNDDNAKMKDRVEKLEAFVEKFKLKNGCKKIPLSPQNEPKSRWTSKFLWK